MISPVGGGFSPVGGGFSPASSGAPAGGAAPSTGAESVGAQGSEGLNTLAGKAHGGDSGFDGINAEGAGKSEAAATGGLKKAEEVVSQLVNALEQMLKQQRQPSGQESSGTDSVGGVSGAKTHAAKANAANAGGAQDPKDPPISLNDLMKLKPCPACMGAPGPHNH